VRPEFSAGGVAVRRFRGRPFVAVITTFKQAVALPKGHPSRGESAADAAMREVREEAGVETTLVEKLDDVRYWYVRDGARQFKVVRFFLLRYRSGSVRNHDQEVASAGWIPLDEAPERLTYRGERDVAARAVELVSR
jgi:8-oxo-dGTP pyrophosphatase MutT (NUDIX family)